MRELVYDCYENSSFKKRVKTLKEANEWKKESINHKVKTNLINFDLTTIQPKTKAQIDEEERLKAILTRIINKTKNINKNK